MSIVFDFLLRIEPCKKRDARVRTIRARDDAVDFLPQGIGIQIADRYELASVQLQRAAWCPACELRRQHAHADEVGAVYLFETSRYQRAHAEQARALRLPLAR